MDTQQQRFDEFFQRAMGRGCEPYPYQRRLAFDAGLPSLLSIPTGLGKTAAVILAWLWRRRFAAEEVRASTPRRLVYCLPMRVLVEQTRDCAVEWLNNVDLLGGGLPGQHRREYDPWRGSDDPSRIRVHLLMGGDLDQDWDQYPERDAILIGTQDMLLSRALNRGYAMSRYRWPMAFGLLNNDALWVMDEVQLMGPAVFSSAQLDWMRTKRFRTSRPCQTIWMSATIEPSFLDTRDRRDAGMPRPEARGLDDGDLDRARERLDAMRPISFFNVKKSKKATTLASQVAHAVSREHAPGTLSLVICNTVKKAREIYAELPTQPPKILLTSRFRSGDRARNVATLMDFESRKRHSESGVHVPDHPGLVCVSTQVVEAGVDVSARQLWSEIAPWPSVIQRLGRLNREGRDNQEARGVFWQPEDDEPSDEKNRVGPYEKHAIKEATILLQAISVGLPARSALECLAAGVLKDRVQKALRLAAAPMPRAADVHDLFSTEPDLHGGFTDVSVFVRSADPNPDVTVFWRAFTPGNIRRLDGPAFAREEGCPVALHQFRGFLPKGRLAHVWDPERRRWVATSAADLRPGMVAMLPGSAGGYTMDVGWTGSPDDRIEGLPPPGPGFGALDDDSSSIEQSWVRLSTHLADTRHVSEHILNCLALEAPIENAILHACAVHDIGKAHPRWPGGPCPPLAHEHEVWAKFPEQLVLTLGAEETPPNIITWFCERNIPATVLSQEQGKRPGTTELKLAVGHKVAHRTLKELRRFLGTKNASKVQTRSGLRHEAASALALWHQYRSGPHEFGALTVYLVAAHHGKVRSHLRSRTPVGGDVFGIVPEDSALAWAGGLPMDFSCAADGAAGEFTTEGFILEAQGWTALVSDLLGPPRPHEAWDTGTVPPAEPRNLGPFRLAYLEALVRASDVRASRAPSEVHLVEH